jgi:hypothetical protein
MGTKKMGAGASLAVQERMLPSRRGDGNKRKRAGIPTVTGYNGDVFLVDFDELEREPDRG